MNFTINNQLIVIAPTAPPEVCGAGDYSYHTARALTKFYSSVEIGVERVPIADVATSVPVAHWEQALARACAADKPSDVLLNYNPISYASWWGWPTGLLAALRRFKATHLDNHLFVLVHETWNSSLRVKPHHLLRNQVAKRSYQQLNKLADGVAVLTEGQKQTLELFLNSSRISVKPIGSSILPPTREAGLTSARQTGVWLTFGLAGTRLRALQMFLPLLKSLYAQGRLQQLHAIGPAADDYARQEAALIVSEFGPGFLRQLGALEPAEVSAQLLSAEAALLGQDAASLHKSSSFAAMAAHAIPIVCTVPASLVVPPGQALFRSAEMENNPQVFTSLDAWQRRELLHQWFWSKHSWEAISQNLSDWMRSPAQVIK